MLSNEGAGTTLRAIVEKVKAAQSLCGPLLDDLRESLRPRPDPRKGSTEDLSSVAEEQFGYERVRQLQFILQRLEAELSKNARTAEDGLALWNRGYF